MLRENKLRRIFAVLFTAIYLFVTLFSQNFHHHGSAQIFKDFHFKKSEKTYSPTNFAESLSECLSCHILHTGNSLVPQDFQFSFVKVVDFQHQIFEYQRSFAILELFHFQLRGPPANFI